MNRRVTDPPDGTRIGARAGQTVEIALPENATTGFAWHVDGDFRLIGEAVSTEFVRGGDAVGAGGTRIFCFVARSPGDAELTFTLRRYHGDSIADRRTVQFSIRA